MSQVEYEDVDQGKEEDEEEQFVAVEEEELDDEHEEEHDDDDEEETRLGGGREEDDEDKRARRREENRSRRQRQREARDRTEKELGFLRKRNEDLERRFSQLEAETDARVTGSEIANVDSAINKAKSDMVLANQVIQESIDNNDGANLAEALDHRDTIRDQLRDLQDAKRFLTDERQQGRAPVQEQLDPRHVAHAQQFMIDHDWWDPSGRDQESQQVLLLDRAVRAEGYEPSEKEYWDTLRERVQETLPHHFEERRVAGDDDDGGDDVTSTGNGRPQRRSRGPQFRTGGRERPLKRNEVYISAERREAMEEAGVWEDPVLRNKFLKAYATYDSEAEGGQ